MAEVELGCVFIVEGIVNVLIVVHRLLASNTFVLLNDVRLLKRLLPKGIVLSRMVPVVHRTIVKIPHHKDCVDGRG